MTSRDGQAFRRWDEAFLRPGPQSAGHWIYGDNYQSYGLWETASPEGTNEISMHFTEYAWLDAKHQSRRYTIRLDGFVSLNAPLSGGELLTKPLLFSGKKLSINYSTSALGTVRVELQADCYAGVWAAYAGQEDLLERGDIEEALNAANSIGDDRLQKQMQGFAVPKTFSHGTSEQRKYWFERGYKEGNPAACDTFNTARL